MTSALKNRLVGTIIIVALAVIFLPDFLDGKKESQEEAFVSVPSAPAKKPIVNPEPFPSERVANAAQRPVEIVEESALDDDTPSTAEPKPGEVTTVENDDDELARQTIVNEPQVAEEDAGWVVQLGSFRHQKNVKQLLTKLENAGYRAFSSPIQTRSGPLTKVFVGPDLDRAKLESALPHLKEVTGLKGKVTTFNAD